MSHDEPASGQAQISAAKRPTERLSVYLWTALVLAIGVVAVVLGWHARGGTTDPTALPKGDRLSHTTVVIDSAILVLREGLETASPPGLESSG
jgi:hypothetical protein